MDDMIQNVKAQMVFYSARYNANHHRSDREMMEFYQNWLSQLIVDQKKINA
tara:strand:- start:479 stop:631 length:153 start_codon:yes stop_codon:yes gene_type:complete